MAWRVIIEEITGFGQNQRWGVSQTSRPLPDRERARQEALGLTGSFTPEHPWSEQSRDVYRVSEDYYVVAVTGATNSFHFKLTVAEQVEPGTGEPPGGGEVAEGRGSSSEEPSTLHLRGL